MSEQLASWTIFISKGRDIGTLDLSNKLTSSWSVGNINEATESESVGLCAAGSFWLYLDVSFASLRNLIAFIFSLLTFFVGRT